MIRMFWILIFFLIQTASFAVPPDAVTLKDFAAKYAEAWCSQNAASVASFFEENGSLKINDGEPSVGRAAITAAAQSFMSAFPDMVVKLDDLTVKGDHAVFHWTLTGTNTGPNGTGKFVKISGYEEWTIGADGLIVQSLGHFDEADYRRQLDVGTQDPDHFQIITTTDAPLLKADPKRMSERIQKLSEFGKNPEGGVSRVAYSDADIQGRKYVFGLMEQAGLKVRVDAAGNMIGRREGRNPNFPVILFGSHIDSVPKGGNYDGDVGVLGAIECIEILNEHKIQTDHPLEVVVFTDEEGGLVGSKAAAGELSPDALKIVSHSGKTIEEGIRAIGGDPTKLDTAKIQPSEILAYLELHIEQGGILEREKINIGVVEGIVGINWWDVTVNGFANHAGTTPMKNRKDALVAAARFIESVNSIATNMPGRQVATVGKIHAEPGAPNVIPGKVVMSLEIRDLSKAKIDQVFEEVQKSANKIATETGTTFRFDAVEATAIPAPTDERLRKMIEQSARDLGLTTKLMPSGAGHDAQDIAHIAPVGMIFVPSIGGISHSPKEFTTDQDMANGASVLLRTILRLDQRL